MSKGIAIILLATALFSAFIATSIVRNYILNQEVAHASEMQTVPVVMASYQIPLGTAISKDHINLVHFPKGAEPKNSFNRLDDVAGRVVSTTLYPGEPILDNRLEKPGAISGLSALIPKGMRAITLKVDDTSSVAGFIRPGNFVDVVTTVKDVSGVDGPISKVILQNVKVIATGHDIERADDGKNGKVIPTVTVLASLDQSERLSLASNTGTIRLVLRNHSDQDEEITDGTTLANLIPQAEKDPSPQLPELIIEKPAPVPERRPARTVYIHKGATVSEAHF